ncbi:leucyl aminopeptidase [Catalinimonas alkaloidigena]|uniref:Probable cytosol aminopeptidase n=2 Tax=Catalinimonas alkaloidigena TaxID=1075417 RepID=A0A1G9RQC5_9BACT|nr:leucyl aminopeptidase [Catalinimonas alkaloidigena]
MIVPLVQDSRLADRRVKLAERAGLDGDVDFEGELKEVALLYARPGKGPRRVYLLGVGQEPDFASVLLAFRSFAHRYGKKLPTRVGIFFQYLTGADADAAGTLTDAAVNGFLLGAYNLGLYKTQSDPPEEAPGSRGAALLQLRTDATADVVERAQATADVQRRILDLVNAPANKVTPQTLVQWAVDAGAQWGFSVTAYDRAQLQEMGAEALLAVGRGSAHPPQLVVMEYKPEGEALPKVALVGKGITFDTGGLSIKPSANMHHMKSDMGGAAAVLGTMELVARLKLPIHLIGVVPTAENAVDASSLRPGDVIGSYSGKTIEVIDTDAEGRLILADGLAYAKKHFDPEILIDLATLTGSVIGTLGYHAAGLFTHDDALAQALTAAGEQTGERVWRLPLWPVYADEMKSDVADIKNYHGKPYAGAITAAKFLEAFTNEHPRWAHLDIAGVAFGSSEFSSMQSATAWGVRLLTTYLSGLVS